MPDERDWPQQAALPWRYSEDDRARIARGLDAIREERDRATALALLGPPAREAFWPGVRAI